MPSKRKDKGNKGKEKRNYSGSKGKDGNTFEKTTRGGPMADTKA